MELLHSDLEHHILVGRVDGEVRLVAARTLVAGTCLFEIQGLRSRQKSRFSVQLDDDVHIEVDARVSADELLARHYWRYLNHGCEPNVMLRGAQVLALRDIGQNEELVFDYETTEFEMAEPFQCRCGANTCRGQIRGFKHLAPAQREALRGRLAAHLLRRIGTA